MKYIKKSIKWTLILIATFIFLNVGVFLYAKITPKIQIKSANSYTLLDNNATVFFQGTGSKEWIGLNSISKYLKDATILSEDKYFYKHKGFDYLRILKAIYVNVLSRSKSQGASTISQQYAKNLFLDFDKTWERKWNEMWLTFELEAHYSKDAILEGYLNTINYGHGKYGIENASKFYFDKKDNALYIQDAEKRNVPKKLEDETTYLIGFWQTVWNNLFK
ncbi:MAG: biosynthetic peptidoglycan transglycosylase [Bacilli bacterium]